MGWKKKGIHALQTNFTFHRCAPLASHANDGQWLSGKIHRRNRFNIANENSWSPVFSVQASADGVCGNEECQYFLEPVAQIASLSADSVRP